MDKDNPGWGDGRVRESARLSFPAWLDAQLDRDDPVGDLARDAAFMRQSPHYPSPPDSSSLNAWHLHMAMERASDEALNTLIEAFAEWSEATP